jgi:glutamyl-Q tRNA(Asp) synthetase
MSQPVFRFAPSSNGALHLGHAYSALLNYTMAREEGGRFLVRIEDLDTTRCTPILEAGILRDLEWLGLEWEKPVRRQSEHFADYTEALESLVDAGLVYPSFLTRGEVRAHIAEAEAVEGEPWPKDPDGVPLFPPIDRQRSEAERRQRMEDGEPFAWRLDMEAACRHIGEFLHWDETSEGPDGETGKVMANPMAWGDVVIARKEIPASYHLAVVVDDALQGITNVVRGRDLFYATAVHRVLQELLKLPVPRYHHHRLVLDENGRKLSKSANDTSIASLRDAGASPHDIMRMIGFEQP